MSPWLNNPEEEEHIEHVEFEPEVKEVIGELNPELLEAAIERAKIELDDRKRFEYESWLTRRFLSQSK